MTGLSPFDEGYVAPPPKPAPEPAAAKSKPAAARPTASASGIPKAKARPVDDEGQPREPLATEVADGIYFRMPEDAYHAVNRWSSSGGGAMMISPATFWEGSWFNLDKPAKDDGEDDTAARIIGRAYHVARLEPDRFADLYVRALDKADYPKGMPVTGTDMAAKLVEMGLSKSGSVMEQAERLRAGGYRGPIWQLELAAWDEARGDRTALKAKVFDEISVDMRRLRHVPQIAALLSDGAAEVSVFWTCDKGIKRKCRFDYLKRESWADFKTFANPAGKHVLNAIRDAFQWNRYYVQAAFYRDGSEAIRSGLLEVQGEASASERALVAAIELKPAPQDCWYVFQEKGGVPNLFARRVHFFEVPVSTTMNAAGASEAAQAKAEAATSRPTRLYRRARIELERASQAFLNYQEIYEPGEPWSPMDAVGDWSDADFNPYWLDEIE